MNFCKEKEALLLRLITQLNERHSSRCAGVRPGRQVGAPAPTGGSCRWWTVVTKSCQVSENPHQSVLRGYEFECDALLSWSSALLSRWERLSDKKPEVSIRCVLGEAEPAMGMWTFSRISSSRVCLLWRRGRRKENNQHKHCVLCICDLFFARIKQWRDIYRWNGTFPTSSWLASRFHRRESRWVPSERSMTAAESSEEHLVTLVCTILRSNQNILAPNDISPKLN